MTKHVEPTRPIEAIPVIERVVEKPIVTAEQLAHLTNAQVLRKTAQVLRINGWCSGRLGYRGRPRCVLGAFAEAVGIEAEEESTIYHQVPAAQVLGRHVFVGADPQWASSSTVIRWNDHVNNEENVIGTLNLLADREEALGRG